MAYIKKTYITGKVIEVDKIYSMRYHSKRVTRERKSKPTPEAQKKINERNALRKLTRILNTNFDENSFHATVTYKPTAKPENADQAKKDWEKFIRKLRRKDKNLKYIAVAEHTKNGNVHFHMVIKSTINPKEIFQAWGHGGIYFRSLEADADYQALAWYLLKESRHTYDDVQRRVFGKRWCESKNLVHPVPKIEKVKADSWRETPVAPKGYVVMQDSVVSGVNENGWPYQYYRCIKLEKRDIHRTEVLRR